MTMAEFLALSAALAWQEIRAGSECCEERLRENANAGLLQARTQEGSCYSLRLQEKTVAYADLREFVRKLEKEGELKRIRAEVDPVLEIAEVTQRVARAAGRQPNSAGPALLFEKPKGSRHPLLINAFGSVRRME